MRVGGAGGFALSIEVEEDARPISWAPAGSRERTARRQSAATVLDRVAGRLVAGVLRPCACRLADAGDESLFAGPASERRRFLDRFVLAINPNHGARVGQFERALRGRNRLLEEGGRNAAWLDAIEREAAELGVAVAAARLDCVRRLEASSTPSATNRRPFRGRSSRFTARSKP